MTKKKEQLESEEFAQDSPQSHWDEAAIEQVVEPDSGINSRIRAHVQKIAEMQGGK